MAKSLSGISVYCYYCGLKVLCPVASGMTSVVSVRVVSVTEATVTSELARIEAAVVDYVVVVTAPNPNPPLQSLSLHNFPLLHVELPFSCF